MANFDLARFVWKTVVTPFSSFMRDLRFMSGVMVFMTLPQKIKNSQVPDKAQTITSFGISITTSFSMSFVKDTATE